MYGIVNKAVKGLLIRDYGAETWEKVKVKSGVNIDTFLSNEPYDDKITYDLAIAAADVLEVPLSVVLHALGEYWILNTGMENYGSLMEAGGNSFEEFMVNLPNFHSRVMLMFPNLQPPEFRVSDIKTTNLHLHYYSDRPGLQDFVEGLISGLGKMFETDIEIYLLEGKKDGLDHDIFHVSWKSNHKLQ